MQAFHTQKTAEIKKSKKELEEKLNISISIKRKTITIEGSAVDEYEASLVFDAINFGFSLQKSLQLKNPENQFKIISIKDFTKKKNLKDIRGRLIGTKGRTKRTIENISDSNIIVKENEVGVIGDAESISEVITALTKLIRGTKQSKTYKFLEKQNTKRKKDILPEKS